MNWTFYFLLLTIIYNSFTIYSSSGIDSSKPLLMMFWSVRCRYICFTTTICPITILIGSYWMINSVWVISTEIYHHASGVVNVLSWFQFRFQIFISHKKCILISIKWKRNRHILTAVVTFPAWIIFINFFVLVLILKQSSPKCFHLIFQNGNWLCFQQDRDS